MTENEKQILRDLKSSAASWLDSLEHDGIDRYSYALEETDQRLRDYVDEVSMHPDDHNLYEVLAVKRFFGLLDRHTWKHKRVQKFFKFYECLKFNGAVCRTRYRLTPIQCFQFASIFGFADDGGNRLVRDAYLFVPRKFSKTTSAASLACYDLLFGDNNAQAYVGANSYEQAKLCFDEIRNIMFDLDPSQRHFRINREKISYLYGKKDSYARCLTANARTQDGLNASMVIMDEYAQARNTAGKNGADLKNVLTSSMGARKSPLTVVITTASDVLDGAFAHELEGVERILRGEAPENDSMFASLFMPDVDDSYDDPHTWAKVQPHLGITVQADYYRHEWDRAQLSAENMLTFKTKLLNVFCINEERWFTVEKARELLSDFDVDKVAHGTPCVVSFDLSVHDDFSAVAYTFYSPNTRNFYSHVDYYFPEGSLSEHPNRQLYSLWHEQGLLRFCRGNVIDVRMIAEDILRRSRNLNIVRIAYDSYKAQDLVNILGTFGRDVLKPYSQTFGAFNLPVETFEMLAYSSPRRIYLNNNDINAWCLGNCTIATDNLENKKPIKGGTVTSAKIDGTICTLMGLGGLSEFER